MYNNDFIIPSVVGGKGSSTDGEHSISTMSVPWMSRVNINRQWKHMSFLFTLKVVTVNIM